MARTHNRILLILEKERDSDTCCSNLYINSRENCAAILKECIKSACFDIKEYTDTQRWAQVGLQL